MPNVHQSTALVCPQPLITSGAMYSSVPTNEFVRKLLMHDLVSIVGKLLLFGFELIPPDDREFAYIIVGAPPGSDCFDKSKSESMM